MSKSILLLLLLVHLSVQNSDSEEQYDEWDFFKNPIVQSTTKGICTQSKHGTVQYYCCFGFESTTAIKLSATIEDISCNPICYELCVNAKCVGYLECDCLPGYVQRNELTCELPVGSSIPNDFISITSTQTPEINGDTESVSISAEVTTYSPGPDVDDEDYDGGSGKVDGKACFCANGHCVSQMEGCVCDDGYTRNFDTKSCEPYCSDEMGFNCANGQCIAPQVCTCNPGYERDERFSNLCKKEKSNNGFYILLIVIIIFVISLITIISIILFNRFAKKSCTLNEPPQPTQRHSSSVQFIKTGKSEEANVTVAVVAATESKV